MADFGVTEYAALAVAASAAVAAAAQYQSGRAQAAALNFNASAEQAAAQAQAQQVEQQTKRRLGEAQAAFAAANVEPEGSSSDVVRDLASQGVLSRQLTLYRGNIGAAGLRFGATQAAAAAPAAAISTVLAGGGRALGNQPRSNTSSDGLGPPQTYQPPSPASYPQTGSY